MLDLETARLARTIVEDCLGVAPDEEVLSVTDPRAAPVARAIARAARAADATAMIQVMPLLDSHGNEPPDAVAAGMVAADVAFTCTTHAITHTHARLEATDAGTRVGVLRGVTEEMLVDGAMTADFHEVKRTTRAVRDRLDAAGSVRVTSEAGTDVTFSVEGCRAFSLDGFSYEEHGFATFPPGEAPVHPAEDTAEGTIVIDTSMDGIGLLDEPIHLTVEEGFVTAVRGGEQADELRRIIEAGDENAGNLAEFSIGTNPAARLIGNQAEDKKRAGTIHFAIGDNESLGGTRRSDIHLDGVCRRPTVELDGDPVVEDGRLLID